MIHKHQAFFVFADFVLSVAMVIITVLALNGYFNKVVEVNSCKPNPVVVLPSPSIGASPSVEPSATASASISGSLKRVVR